MQQYAAASACRAANIAKDRQRRAGARRAEQQRWVDAGYFSAVDTLVKVVLRVAPKV